MIIYTYTVYITYTFLTYLPTCATSLPLTAAPVHRASTCRAWTPTAATSAAVSVPLCELSKSVMKSWAKKSVLLASFGYIGGC